MESSTKEDQPSQEIALDSITREASVVQNIEQVHKVRIAEIKILERTIL
jgi:hypothetical protein